MTQRNPVPGSPARILNVLVVDDDPLILTVVDLMVRHAGHTVRTVAGAVEALDVLADQPADVLVSDIRMPGMDGLMLARMVRKDYPMIPIILMTGYLSEYSNGSASQIGVDAILRKPFKSNDLIDAISRTVGY